MIRKVEKYCVEVFLLENVKTFDFGDWAIAIFKSDDDYCIVAYFGNDYTKYFMTDICDMIGSNKEKSFIISPKIFNEIKSVAKICYQSEEERSDLLFLLKHNFHISF